MTEVTYFIIHVGIITNFSCTFPSKAYDFIYQKQTLDAHKMDRNIGNKINHLLPKNNSTLPLFDSTISAT
jgi:hypothetical protein